MNIPIRVKMVLVTCSMLAITLTAYMALAMTLFTQDKLDYARDQNALLAATLSEQTHASLDVLGHRGRIFARAVERKGTTLKQQRIAAQDLFVDEPDILQVRLFKQDPGGGWLQHKAFTHDSALPGSGLDRDGLKRLRETAIVPLNAATEHGMVLANNSVAPDVALLTMALVYHDGDAPRALSIDFRHDRLLTLFAATSTAHTTTLVNHTGHVLAHPETARVIGHADRPPHPMTLEALEDTSRSGTMAFEDNDGRAHVGAYSRIDESGLVVLSETPKAVILAARGVFVTRSLLFALVAALLSIVVCALFARRLTSPIDKLVAATHELGQGRFDIDVEIHSRDEIGALAKAIRATSLTLKNTQDQLIRSEKLAVLGQLGAGVTHEIKGPVTSIAGFAQLGQLKLEQPDKLREYLEMIAHEATRCQDILARLLMFARQESRALEAIDVNAAIETTAHIARHQLGVHGVKLSLDLTPQLPPVNGNEGELQQVLLNLMINAQQAMHGGGEVRIVTALSGTGRPIISVIDNGEGIPEDLLESIFEPFFTTKPKGEGTGLGLPICASIIHSFGGELTARNNGDHGATFSISLPPCAHHVEAQAQKPEILPYTMPQQTHSATQYRNI